MVHVYKWLKYHQFPASVYYNSEHMVSLYIYKVPDSAIDAASQIKMTQKWKIKKKIAIKCK